MMLLGIIILVRHRERSQNTRIRWHKSRRAVYLKVCPLDTLTLSSLVVTARFNTNITAFCPHCIPVFGMILTIIRALHSLYPWLIRVINIYFSLQKAVLCLRRTLAANTWVWSRTIPREISGEKTWHWDTFNPDSIIPPLSHTLPYSS